MLNFHYRFYYKILIQIIIAIILIIIFNIFYYIKNNIVTKEIKIKKSSNQFYLFTDENDEKYFYNSSIILILLGIQKLGLDSFYYNDNDNITIKYDKLTNNLFDVITSTSNSDK